MVRRIEEHGWTVTAAAEAAGLSVRRAYHWLGRYRAAGERMLHDRSSAPARYRPGAGRAGGGDRAPAPGADDRPADRPPARMPRSPVAFVLRRLGTGRFEALRPRPPAARYER